MNKHRFFPLVSAACLSLAVSCSTPSPEASAPLESTEKESMLKRAKAPQVFGLTAYNSDQGAVFAGIFRQHENHIGRIALSSDANSTTPVIAINGGEAMMLLDSSSAESWITVEAALSQRVMPLVGPTSFEKLPRHVYDTIGGFAGVMPKMIIDDLHVENALFYIRNSRGPLDGLTRWEKKPYLDGVLGADFLTSFQFVRISLRGHYIVLSATDAYPIPGNVAATLPIVELQGGIATEVMMDGEKLQALIDIAGDFEVAMQNPAARIMRQVSLGDVVFRQVEVDSAFDLGLGTASPPRIGRQLLEKYDIVINKRGTELLLEVPPK